MTAIIPLHTDDYRSPNCFSTCLKREIASVLRIEEYLHAGYVLEDFHQGEEGHCWFIILSGSVKVVVAGKVCPSTDII